MTGRWNDAAPSRRTVGIAVALLLAVGVLVAAGVGVYFAIGSGPDEAALAEVEADPDVSVERLDGTTAVRSGPVTAETTGLVYYPGARVNPESYVPSAAETVAGRDLVVVIVDTPLNLAVLGQSRADGAREPFPAIDSWAVGGHSLGGAMACRYAAANTADLDALVLHAAYCDRDISDTDLRALSVLDDSDGVIDTERERESRVNLPPETRIVGLSGVNHAGFGAYGTQRGDESVETDPREMRAAVGNVTGPWLVE